MSYSEKHLPMTFWRTSTGLEVDLIVGDCELAIEFKSKSHVKRRDLKGLLALTEDQSVNRAICVSCDNEPRKLEGDISIYPWQSFCEELWAGKLC